MEIVNEGSHHDPNNTITKFGFLILNEFTALAVTAAIDVLNLANDVIGKPAYQWQVLSLDGNPVNSSANIQIGAHSKLESANVDTLIICSGQNIDSIWSESLKETLQKYANNGTKLGGVCTGAYILARSGLLDGYSASIHWTHIEKLAEEFPKVKFAQDLFKLDRDRFTCSGGITSIDMMVELVRRDQGVEVAHQISELMICERVRTADEIQPTYSNTHPSNSPPRLKKAVTLMEANITKPISLDHLSQQIGISKRQLERLFSKHLNCVPNRYYLELRLNRARQLLLQSDKPIVEVSQSCGFVSSPHFSKCYKQFFGHSPRDERRFYIQRAQVK